MLAKVSTVLFALLIATLLVPTMIDSASAAKTYTREQVDRAFFNADDNISFNDKNKMKVDVKSMKESGMPKKEIKIVKQYARLHNALIKAMISENDTLIAIAKTNLHDGKFAMVFNDTAYQAPPPGGVTGAGFWDSSACGITNGVTSTYPPTPTLYIGTNGHASQSNIETWLRNNGQHIVNWPYADWGDLVYAEKNITGQGSCTNGEFRDEWNVYEPDALPGLVLGGVTASGWYTLNHDNEPNPEVLDYSPPTYWWIGFVVYWHDHY